jgi:hypothetical protein
MFALLRNHGFWLFKKAQNHSNFPERTDNALAVFMKYLKNDWWERTDNGLAVFMK